MMSLILFGVFFILVLANVPIAISLGVSTLFGLSYMGFDFEMLAPILYAGITKVTLIAIPFFIFAGLIMERAGISSRLINLAEVFLGKRRSGLAMITVVVACFFAAISGSGPATVAAIGVVLIPAMIEKGYGREVPTALMAASGSIGVIIPPSVVFVIYAVLAEISVTRLFLAGIIPGLLMGVCYLICALFLIRNKDIEISEREYTRKEKRQAFIDAFWGLMTPVIILGGIYGGFFTPTEAAGVAVVYGLFIGVFIYKSINIKDIFSLLVETAIQSAVVMFIVACAGLFAWLLTTSLVAQQISGSILGLTSNKMLILLLMNIIFLVTGCFLDTISALYILVPVMLPIIKTLGVDPYAFGVMMTVNLGIGQCTPPVGANLFVACNISSAPLKDMIRVTIPFVIAGFIGLMIITYIPQISLLLPNILMGK